MTDRIDTPYWPDDVQGELGWIWLEGWGDFPGESGWAPVVTWLPDSQDAEPQIRIVRADDEDREYPADDFSGRPYLSAAQPKCPPGCPLEVAVRLPHGGSAAFTFPPDIDPAKVDGIRDAVIEACSSGYLGQASEALRTCLALHYASLRSDIECFSVIENDTPVLRSMDRDDIAFLTHTVQAIRGAEAVLGRDLPADTPAWLPEAIDRWDDLLKPEAVS